MAVKRRKTKSCKYGKLKNPTKKRMCKKKPGSRRKKRK